MEPEMLKGMSYAMAGALVVSMSVWLIWSLLRRAAKRSDSEGTLDQRATTLVNAVQGVYDKMVDELRGTITGQDEKIGRLHEELFTAYKRFGEIVGQQQTTIAQEVAKVRDVHNMAMERVHTKLDQCTTDHKQCQSEQMEIRGEVNALRQMVGSMQPSVNVNVDQHRAGRRTSDPVIPA